MAAVIAFARGVAMGIAMAAWFLQLALSWSAGAIPVGEVPSFAQNLWWRLGAPAVGLTAITYLMRRRPSGLGPYIGVAVGIALLAILTLVGVSTSLLVPG